MLLTLRKAEVRKKNKGEETKVSLNAGSRSVNDFVLINSREHGNINKEW